MTVRTQQLALSDFGEKKSDRFKKSHTGDCEVFIAEVMKVKDRQVTALFTSPARATKKSNEQCFAFTHASFGVGELPLFIVRPRIIVGVVTSFAAPATFSSGEFGVALSTGGVFR